MSESSIDKSINLGAVGEALNDKMDRDGLNADIKPAAGYDVDYVVEWKTLTASDPTWYRKYASGWVEQGGTLSNSDGSATLHTITLPIPMQNTYYYASRSNYYTGNNHDPYADYIVGIREKTTTTIKIWSDATGHTTNTMWEVKGMAA